MSSKIKFQHRKPHLRSTAVTNACNIFFPLSRSLCQRSYFQCSKKKLDFLENFWWNKSGKNVTWWNFWNVSYDETCKIHSHTKGERPKIRWPACGRFFLEPGSYFHLLSRGITMELFLGSITPYHWKSMVFAIFLTLSDFFGWYVSEKKKSAVLS